MQKFSFSYRYKSEISNRIINVMETFVKNDFSETYNDEYCYYSYYDDDNEPWQSYGYCSRESALDSYNWALQYDGMDDKKKGHDNVKLLCAVRQLISLHSFIQSRIF